MNTERLAFRFTQNDRDNLVAIATGLRAAGRPFANKTDALRHALTLAATAAQPMPTSVPAGGAP